MMRRVQRVGAIPERVPGAAERVPTPVPDPAQGRGPALADAPDRVAEAGRGEGAPVARGLLVGDGS